MKFSYEIDGASVRTTIRELERYGEQTQKKITQAIGETGFSIQRDAKIGAPVKYGVLWSSLYVDFKKGVSKEIRYDSRAKISPRFPPAESQQNGMDVIIGSTMEYAETMEKNHPTKSRFLQNASDFHFPRLKRAIDILLAREAR